MAQLTYAIIGSGYRAQYYARIAVRWPALFRACFLCRSEEKARSIFLQTGVPATVSVENVLSMKPDFAVIAVNKDSVADVAVEWIERGIPVLLETPAGSTPEQLKKLWELEQQGAKIAVCEQYHRYPILHAGIEAIDQGLIGEPRTAYLSIAHDYHGASLLRRMLKTAGEHYTMTGIALSTPVTRTDSRYEAFYDGESSQEERDVVQVLFDSGKHAVYDFAGVQYRTFIRSRHITVRGEKGEWSDTIVSYVNEENEPVRKFLMPNLPRDYRQFDTQDLKDLRKSWRPELSMETLQDEFAISTILYDMGAFIEGGPAPYSLKEGLEDALFYLTLKQAAGMPFVAVSEPQMPWQG